MPNWCSEDSGGAHEHQQMQVSKRFDREEKTIDTSISLSLVPQRHRSEQYNIPRTAEGVWTNFSECRMRQAPYCLSFIPFLTCIWDRPYKRSAQVRPENPPPLPFRLIFQRNEMHTNGRRCVCCHSLPWRRYGGITIIMIVSGKPILDGV